MIYVSGATGKLGRPLVARLLARGESVRALVRSAATAALPPAVELVEGDVTVPASLAGTLTGVTGVLHLVGRMSEGDPSDTALRAELDRVNVDGSLALMRAARAAGVRRFVYVSSCVVYGYRSGDAISADTPPTPETAYGGSKWAAEQALARESGPELVVVRPALVAAGKSDRHDVLGEMVRLARRGLFPLPAAARGARKALIAAGDVADGILAALDRGRPGAAYVLAARRAFSLEEILGQLSRLLGRRTTVPVPLALLNLAAYACDTVLAPLGLPAPIGARRLAKLLRDQQFDVSKSVTELGFAPAVEDLEALLAPYL